MVTYSFQDGGKYLILTVSGAIVYVLKSKITGIEIVSGDKIKLAHQDPLKSLYIHPYQITDNTGHNAISLRNAIADLLVL